MKLRPSVFFFQNPCLSACSQQLEQFIEDVAHLHVSLVIWGVLIHSLSVSSTPKMIAYSLTMLISVPILHLPRVTPDKHLIGRWGPTWSLGFYALEVYLEYMWWKKERHSLLMDEIFLACLKDWEDSNQLTFKLVKFNSRFYWLTLDCFSYSLKIFLRYLVEIE